MFCFVLEEVKR